MKPDKILETLKKHAVEGRISGEACIRRAISALYFSLFNYWAAKKYDQGARGRGPRQDRFDYREFHEELLGKGLDAELVFLYVHRVAADHYVLNPTDIKVYGREMASKLPRRPFVHIDAKTLERAIEAVEEILKNV